jgi:predicted nucleic acid-binding protein
VRQVLGDLAAPDLQKADDAFAHFEELVVGPAVETLDDGEAATIAYAMTHSATALIDERKATRICRERFPALRLACTIDVLIHADVQTRLGPALLADAVVRALQEGQMRVFSHHAEWVIGLIGDERAALCPSLPRRAVALRRLFVGTLIAREPRQHVHSVRVRFVPQLRNKRVRDALREQRLERGEFGAFPLATHGGSLPHLIADAHVHPPRRTTRSHIRW